MARLQLQEFFSSADSRIEMRRLLKESGFAKTDAIKELHNAYVAEEVFLNLQRRIIDRTVPHRHIFVMELYRPLEELEAEHPVFRLFERLNQPIIYGKTGLKDPKYGIQEYAGIVIPYANPNSEGGEGNLCVEWVRRRWSRTVRNLNCERVETMPGLGKDEPAYCALLTYFRLDRLDLIPTQDELELLSPGKLEVLARSGL